MCSGSTRNAEGVDIFCVVGVGHSAAQPGAQASCPVCRRRFLVQDMRETKASITRRLWWQQSRPIGMVAWLYGSPVAGIEGGGGVNYAERVGHERSSRWLRCGLKLAAHIEYEPPGYGIAAGAGVVVEAVIVRTAIVVDDG